MNKRVLQGMLLLSAIALVSAGCGQNGKPMASNPSATVSPTGGGADPNTKTQQAPAPEMNVSKVKVYYSDEEGANLVEKEATISYKQQEEVYAAALEALKKSDDPKLTSLFSNVAFKSAKFDKGTGDLKVDLSYGAEAQLGSGGEILFLDALKRTAFQFSEVKSLSIVRDGKQVESLMGHIELLYPIKRPN